MTRLDPIHDPVGDIIEARERVDRALEKADPQALPPITQVEHLPHVFGLRTNPYRPDDREAA